LPTFTYGIRRSATSRLTNRGVTPSEFATVSISSNDALLAVVVDGSVGFFMTSPANAN
jgi:hypothetical protein